MVSLRLKQLNHWSISYLISKEKNTHFITVTVKLMGTSFLIPYEK